MERAEVEITMTATGLHRMLMFDVAAINLMLIGVRLFTGDRLLPSPIQRTGEE